MEGGEEEEGEAAKNEERIPTEHNEENEEAQEFQVEVQGEETADKKVLVTVPKF